MKRITEVDFLRGVAIILVVIGHCIQTGFGYKYRIEGLFYYNQLFKIIYSFHMPLFMLISGYIGYKNENKINIKNKINRLIIPMLIWQFFFTILFYSFKKNIDENFIDLFLKNFYYTYWFLWTVFLISLLVSLIKFFPEKIQLFLYIVIILLGFFTTDRFNFVFIKFLFPYYLIGYYLRKNNVTIEKAKEYFKIKNFYILFFVEVVLMNYYEYNTYIYISGYNIIGNFNQIFIDMYRFIIGLLGSILIIMLILCYFNKIGEKIKNIISYFGKKSLSIYLIQGYLMILLARQNFIIEFNFFVLVIEAIVIFLLVVLFIKIIEKLPFGYILLGEKK